MSHKKVYLIRHGITRANEERRFNGQGTDEALSDAGVAAAGAVSAPAADRVCCGPLLRARQTAEILFSGMTPAVIDPLTEMDLGILEGKKHEELDGNPKYRAWIDSGGTIDVPGGEKKSDFTERSVRGFYEALGDHGVSETVAVVCHGGNIMAVMSSLFGGQFYDYLTDNLGGYCIDLEMDDEGIHDGTYHKLDTGHPA